MSAYPIADTALEALEADRPLARTAQEAARRVRRPAYLAVQELPGAYPDIAAAEAAIGDLYGQARFELTFRDKAWRVMVRFWRPAPRAPVGRTASGAARRPLGFAGSPEEAHAILGAPAERAFEPLGRPYATRARALQNLLLRPLIEQGHVTIEERGGRFVPMLHFWRPIAAALSPAERSELAARAGAPLRSAEPQADPYIGLFEALAPENPTIILADEGDGRARGE